VRTVLVLPRLWLRRWLASLDRFDRSLARFMAVESADSQEPTLLAFPARARRLIRPDLVLYTRFLELSRAMDRPANWTSHPWPSHVRCRLWLGGEPGHRQIWGAVLNQGQAQPLDELSLPGPGMSRIHLQNNSPNTHHHPVSDTLLDRHSRTIGALGGEPIWQTLRNLKIQIIGCGRSGSLIAANLARLGVHELTLTDPDLLEEHNLGEMDLVSSASLGQPKVEVLRNSLNEITDNSLSVTPLACPVTAPAAIQACRDADVIFCCVDNDTARLAAGTLATLHHKVLVDIGTGVHLFRPESLFPSAFTGLSPRLRSMVQRTMGADVRLILPGDGCVLCRGGLANFHQAALELTGRHSPPSSPVDWRRQRAGSLRSLNQMAAGLATQMLQDLVARQIRSSSWARLEGDQQGRFHIRYPTLAPPPLTCPLCARAGLGESGRDNWQFLAPRPSRTTNNRH